MSGAAGFWDFTLSSDHGGLGCFTVPFCTFKGIWVDPPVAAAEPEPGSALLLGLGVLGLGLVRLSGRGPLSDSFARARA